MKDLKDNTYVDDVQSGGDIKEELIRFKEEATKIISEGGFQLHKWHSNAPVVDSKRTSKSTEGETTYARLTFGTQPPKITILEIPCNTETDEFPISFSECLEKENGGATTKRKMLSTINCVFDILGLASSVIISGKTLNSLP